MRWSDVKSSIFSVVRETHSLTRLKPLPRKLGLCFHELEPDQYASFRAAMEFIQAHGYRSVDPTTFAASNDSERQMLVTFDDNYKSWHSALPLLKELGIHATFYINTLPVRDLASDKTIREFYDRIDFHRDRTPLSRGEIVDLVAAGHTIGAHTRSHYDLGKLPSALWDAEIKGCKQDLEEIIGEEVLHFSWPFGMRRNFPPALRKYCSEIGFATIAAGTPGLLHTKKVDPLNIQRTRWLFTRPLDHNLTDIRIDGRLFEAITGRSAIG